MANELTFVYGVTGATVVARLIQNGAQVGTDISMSELSAAPGVYSASMPTGIAAGGYVVAFVAGGVTRGAGYLIWDGQAEYSAVEQALTPRGPLVPV